MTTNNEQTELIIENCWFHHEVRLTDLTTGPTLIFNRCVFENGFVGREARLDRSLVLRGCVLKNGKTASAVDLDNARIGGDLILDDCLLEGQLTAARIEVEKSIRLYDCRIARSLLSIMDPIAIEEIENWDEPLNFDKGLMKLNLAINFHQAHVQKDLQITGSTVKDSPAALIFGKIYADQINLGGNLYLFGALCHGDVSIQGAHIKGNALTSNHQPTSDIHFRATGALLFNDTVIDGSVSFYQTTVNGNVSLYHTTVGGNVALLGLATGGNLDLQFAKMGAFVAAYRDAKFPGSQRRSLTVGGDLRLSGANVKTVELRGADIGGDVIATTGQFGELILSMGPEPIDGPNRIYYAKSCTASSIRMTAINVEGDLDISGVKVTLTENEREQERERMLREGGIVLTQCTIGRNLLFFMDDVQLTLERRWTEAIPWNTVPETWEYSASTWGNLVLRTNHIGGNLDLRNVKVEGDLHLNNTNINLNLNIGAGHAIYEGFKTECRNFDADKLECGGDAAFTGLEVRNNFKARAARVKGDFLFLPRERKQRRTFVAHPDDAEHESAADESKPRRDYAGIGGDLDLTAVTTDHLVLSGANLRKRKRSEEKARISLERVKVGRLEIVRPPLLGTVNLAGVSVHRWAFGDPHQNETQEPTVDSYIDVLSENKPFDRATWIEVETALRNQARDGDANRVYRQMRKTARAEWPVLTKDFTWRRYFRNERRRLSQLRRHPKKWLSTKKAELFDKARLVLWHLWDRIQFVSIGYGTRVWVPMIPTVILFAMSLIIFSQAEYVRASPALLQVLGTNAGAQHQPMLVNVSPYEQKLNVCPNKDQWTKLDALALSLRYHVPIVSSMTHTWWEAGTKTIPGTGITAERYALIVEVYHWIAWPLFLIGAAALVFRGRQK